ncbi:MAG TPA: sigma-70 family RNA polymerase sigma factor [Candidatus Methylacidiphilales bacterium]
MENGDRARFEGIFLPHCDAAYNLARWLLRDERDAEDAVQDAYVRAFQAFGRFRGRDGDAGKAWFLTIVRHLCYSILRKRQRHGEEAPFDEELHHPDGETPAEADLRLWREARAEVLREALGNLRPEFREMIVMCDLEGMEYKAIADVAGVPIGTVMSRLSRARTKLRAEVVSLMKEKEASR